MLPLKLPPGTTVTIVTMLAIVTDKVRYGMRLISTMHSLMGLVGVCAGLESC